MSHFTWLMSNKKTILRLKEATVRQAEYLPELLISMRQLKV